MISWRQSSPCCLEWKPLWAPLLSSLSPLIHLLPPLGTALGKPPASRSLTQPLLSRNPTLRQLPDDTCYRHLMADREGGFCAVSIVTVDPGAYWIESSHRNLKSWIPLFFLCGTFSMRKIYTSLSFTRGEQFWRIFFNISQVTWIKLQNLFWSIVWFISDYLLF